MIDLHGMGAAFKRELMSDVEDMVRRMLAALGQPLRIVDIPVTLGTRGTPLTVGTHLFFRLGLNGTATILTWSLGATVAGVASARSVTVDVQVAATLAAVATICGTAKPALVSQSELSDQVPAVSWTTTIVDRSWMLVTVTAVDSVIEVVGLTLRCAVQPR